MGGSHSNFASINQTFMNNIVSRNQENCISSTYNTTSGNYIFVEGSTIVGNIGILQGTSTDSSCLMVSAMENTIKDIMTATSKQSNNTSNDWFGGFSWTGQTNAFDLMQSSVNNISQINQLTCAASSMQTTSNNFIYVRNSNVSGNVGIVNTSSAQANCSMTNMMKNYSYNYMQGDNNQDNAQKGMFVAIVAAICTLIGIIIIGVVILFAVGAIGYAGYELVSPKKTVAAGGGGDDFAATLASLGLSTNDINMLDEHVGAATPTISDITPLQHAAVSPTPVPATPVAVTTAVPPHDTMAAAGNSLLANVGQGISTQADSVSSTVSQHLSEAGSALSSKAEDFASRALSKITGS